MFHIKKSNIRILFGILLISSIFNISTSGSVSVEIAVINSIVTIISICLFLVADQQEQDELNDLFMIDPLTKLPNKYGLENHFSKHIKGQSRSYALITLDIDDFKKINDRYGHKTGDDILINLAQCIEEVCGYNAFVCRSYGDEFSVLIPVSDELYAKHFANTLFNNLKVFLNDNSVVTLSNLSMGIALYPNHADNFQDLYKYADHALFYRKHEAGKNGYTMFSLEIFKVAHEEEKLAREFNMAMDNNQIILNFQPQIHSSSMEVVGAEVLTRWMHPEKGLIFPDKFIPIAEKKQSNAKA